MCSHWHCKHCLRSHLRNIHLLTLSSPLFPKYCRSKMTSWSSKVSKFFRWHKWFKSQLDVTAYYIFSSMEKSDCVEGLLLGNFLINSNYFLNPRKYLQCPILADQCLSEWPSLKELTKTTNANCQWSAKYVIVKCQICCIYLELNDSLKRSKLFRVWCKCGHSFRGDWYRINPFDPPMTKSKFSVDTQREEALFRCEPCLRWLLNSI